MLLYRLVPDDLEGIFNQLTVRSPAVADRFIEAAEATLERLATMPGTGSPKHFRARKLAGLRTWPIDRFPNHLIFYGPIDEGIFVLAVLHGARNIAAALRTRV